MLIFRNATMEYCLMPEVPRMMADIITPDGTCPCWVDEAQKNLRASYTDGTQTVADISILINANSVSSEFSPAYVRYKGKRDSTFSPWHKVKSVEWFDLVKSIRITCL